jgi:hypothetical protein
MHKNTTFTPLCDYVSIYNLRACKGNQSDLNVLLDLRTFEKVSVRVEREHLI